MLSLKTQFIIILTVIFLDKKNDKSVKKLTHHLYNPSQGSLHQLFSPSLLKSINGTRKNIFPC